MFKKNKKSLKKMFLLFRPYILHISIILVCFILSAAINLANPIITQHLVDKGLLERNLKILVFYAALGLILVFFNNFLEFVKEYIRSGISLKIKFKLFQDAFKHLEIIQINYFKQKNSSEILNELEIDIRNISKVADNNMFFVVAQVLSFIGGLVGILLIDIRLTLIVALFIPLKFISIKMLTHKKENLIRMLISLNSKFAKWFGDTINGISEIRLFGIQRNKELEFNTNFLQIVKTERSLNTYDNISFISEDLLVNILISIIYVLGASFVFGDTLSIGSLFAFLTYSTQVMNPISSILNLNYALTGIIPSIERYYSFLSLDTEQSKIIDSERRGVHEFESLEFKNVSFSYDNSTVILDNVNFKINKGEKIAFVGENGAGKSTILSLIERFYVPSQGQILINGILAEKCCIKDYRDLFAYISQDIHLFNLSIAENILLYKEIDEIQLTSIINLCRLNDIYSKLGQKSIGQNGSLLSGGQKQKIALARALLHNKSCLILDEATSSFDNEMEMLLFELFKTTLKDRTIITITHKKDYLKYVDNVFLVDARKVTLQSMYCKDTN